MHIQIQPLLPERLLSTVELPFDAPEELRDRATAALLKAGWGKGAAR
jgi:hypothetical protein